MDNLLSLRRSVFVYGLCLPIAVLVGYLLARPASFSSLAFVGLLLGVLSLPLLIRWHHEFLILTWNAALIVPLLPGQPAWWMCASLISLTFALLLRIMTKKGDFVSAPSVTFWICFVLVTVVVTAMATGGIGARAIGSAAYGGKRYLYLFLAVVGYFALIGTRIRPEQARFLAVGFFLSALTSAISDLAFLLGPTFHFLYHVFPAGLAYSQAVGEEMSLGRFAGISFGAQAAMVAMVACYGFRGLLTLSVPWRLPLFIACLTTSLFGGFRSSLILSLLFFVFQFYFERLFTARNLAIVAGLLVLSLVGLVNFATKLPAAVQRAVSFLPVQVDESVRIDAAGTTEWRWLMWKTLLPEVPKYLWVGKGFTFSGTDLYLTQESMRRGYYPAYESTLITGNYHNGILTMIIPFGIWGLIGFLGFLVAAIRVLYFNYRNSDPPLKTVNTLLISWFLARLVMYFTIFGAFDLDFPFFVGIVGLSLSLNGGISLKNVAPKENSALADAIPALARPRV